VEDAAEGPATPRSHGPAEHVHLAPGRASVDLGEAVDELWTRPPGASTTCGQHERDSVLHTLLDRRVAPVGNGTSRCDTPAVEHQLRRPSGVPRRPGSVREVPS
jgi:hypothetical protein